MLENGDFQLLTSFKWKDLSHLADLAGISTVVAMLKDIPEQLQREIIQDFVNRELANLRQRASTPSTPTTYEAFKLDVSSYSCEGPKRLVIYRWLCEVDIAV